MGFLAARGSTRTANTRQCSIPENVCFSVQMVKERRTRLGMAPPTLNLQSRDKKRVLNKNLLFFNTDIVKDPLSFPLGSTSQTDLDTRANKTEGF